VPGKNTIEVLEVRSTEGHLYQAIVIDVVAREEPNDPSVVFTRRGDRTFLSEVWESGKQVGGRLRSSMDQTEIAEDENEKITLTSTD
jgi:hypothetical protein